MKEKLKKILTNKEFWTALIGCLGLLLSIALSYFSGFKDGVLLDNTIRTELIGKGVDETKNDKKGLNISQYDYIAIPYSSIVTDSIIFDVGLIVEKFKIYYEDIYNSNILAVNESAYLCCDITFYNNLATGQIFYIRHHTDGTYKFRVTIFDDLPYSIDNGYLSIEGANYSPIICSITETGVTSINNSYYGSYFIDNFYNYFNSNIFGVYNSQLFDLFEIGCFLLPNTTEAYNNGYENGYNVGFNDYTSSEEYRAKLEETYQNGINVGYDVGRIEGVSEFKTSQEFRNILKEEFDKGYQAREDSVEDTEQKINSIWTILEKAITSVLNVLSFEILPGMPLYICVGVPILLAVLLWFIKMGQS